MNSYKLLIALGVVGTMMLASCDDFLDVKTKGIYTPDNYFKNEASVVNAASGLYALMIPEEFTGHVDYTWDICSDDIYRAGDHADDEAIETFTFDAANSQLSEGWNYKYEMVSRANNIIMNVPDMENISADIRNRSVGEAYFFRAFAFWWLYLPYGEIPLIVEKDVLETNYNKPKSTIDEVLTRIESDLKAAADNLSEVPDPGRISKGTAWAYLTQLYMHWASYEGQESKLASAIRYGEMITGNSRYGLAPEYGSNFRQSNVPTSEMLLYIASSTWRKCNNISYFSVRSWGGWGFFHPLPGLFEAFGDDPRRIHTMWAEGDMVDMVTQTVPYANVISETGHHLNKYTTFNSAGALEFNLLTPIMRSADVYLLVAEAKIRQSGPGAGDAEINAVRARVGLPALTGAGKEELIRERRLELAGENRRHFDLVRWDKIGWVDLPALYSDPKSSFVADVGRKKFIRPKHYFFPLPQSEIDKSNGVLIQNSNY
jgi:hypothetical protein